MRLLIVAAGNTQWAQPRASDLLGSDWDLIVAADGGAAQALAFGLEPDLVIGDMDSMPFEVRDRLEAQECRFIVHPRAKDETDLELALTHAAELGATEILVLGALGGRLDHTLANLLLLAHPVLEGIRVRIVDDNQRAELVRGGEELILRGQPGDLISLLPLAGDCHGVSTSGMAWPLNDDVLHFGFSRGVSNEMVGTEASLYLHQGLLLVVQSRRDRAAAAWPGDP